jgi:hypothetical protein
MLRCEATLEDWIALLRCLEHVRGGKSAEDIKETMFRLVKKGSSMYLGRYAAQFLSEQIKEETVAHRRNDICIALNELLERDLHAADYLAYSGEVRTYKERLKKFRELPGSLEKDKAQCYSRLLYTAKRGKMFDYRRLGHEIGLRGCILVIGAGFSYSSHIHITSELGPLMGQAFKVMSEKNPGLEVPPEPDPMNCDHWKILKQEPLCFQSIFRAKNDTKAQSSQHVLARKMFSDNRINHIVSFNWDNLVEKASDYRIRKVNSDEDDSDHALWKLHGDVDKIGERWIFPFDDGRVFPRLVDKLGEAAENNVPIISLGYTWRDQKVMEQLKFLKEKVIPINSSWYDHLDFVVDDVSTGMDQLEMCSKPRLSTS